MDERQNNSAEKSKEQDSARKAYSQGPAAKPHAVTHRTRPSFARRELEILAIRDELKKLEQLESERRRLLDQEIAALAQAEHKRRRRLLGTIVGLGLGIPALLFSRKLATRILRPSNRPPQA